MRNAKGEIPTRNENLTQFIHSTSKSLLYARSRTGCHKIQGIYGMTADFQGTSVWWIQEMDQQRPSARKCYWICI